MSELLTRRHLLRRAAIGVPVTAAALTLLAGCGQDTSQPSTTQLEPTTAPGMGEEFGTSREPLTQEIIRNMALEGIEASNNILGTSIDRSFADRFTLASTIEDYKQKMLERGATPDDVANADWTQATTTHTNEVIVNEQALRNMGYRSKEAMMEQLRIIEWHELVHLVSAQYLPPQMLIDTVFRGVYNGGYPVEAVMDPLLVDGAKIVAMIDGVVQTAFQPAEEAEARAISEYLYSEKTGIQYSVDYHTAETELVKDLVHRFGNEKEGMSMLAQLRMSQNGREEWLARVGQQVPGVVSSQSDQLLAGATVYAMISGAYNERYNSYLSTGTFDFSQK